MGTYLHQPCEEEGERHDTHSSRPHSAATPRLPLTRCSEGTLSLAGSGSSHPPWSHLGRAEAQGWTWHAPETGTAAGPYWDRKSE